MRRSEETVLEIDGGGLSVLRASVAGGGVSVASLERFRAPEEVGSGDIEAFDRWAGRQLREAGVRGRLVGVVTRGDVVLKVLSLPGAQTLEEGDLAQPVRLQMDRQTVSVEHPIVDYVRLEEESPGGSDARVLCAALGGAWAERLRTIARGAGSRLSGIALRSIGAAAMLRNTIGREHEVVLGIAVGPASTEIVVLRRGRLVFARMVEIGLSREGSDESPEKRAKGIAVEAKRTWMSYRSLRDSTDVDVVAVLGDGPEAERLARVCGEALELEGRAAGVPEGVRLEEGLEGVARLHAATLAGPVFARVKGEPALDFANPRRPLDRAAARRQRVLLGAFGAIVVGGAGYLVAQQQLGVLERRVGRLQEEWQGLAMDHVRMLRREARAEHLSRWTGQRADWLAHLEYLSERMPARSEALVDAAEGAQRRAIDFSSSGGRYSDGSWSERFVVEIALEGRTRDRSVGNALRARLLTDGIYEVHSRGPDSATTFALELVTSEASPLESTGGEEDGS